jgi:hypothetical protein
VGAAASAASIACSRDIASPSAHAWGKRGASRAAHAVRSAGGRHLKTVVL